MKSTEIDWARVRRRAAELSDEAFDFVRDGLKHTVSMLQAAEVRVGDAAANGGARACGTGKRHVTGRELCEGLRDLAGQRWGMLAGTVLRRWGIERTEDFGTIVYAMIDRRELKASETDSPADFKDVYEFAGAFGGVAFRA
ncbi:MAG: hypothetical protein IT438_09735 [Phycisphaerales bacterium]|nr:hypothetical protein [Phycisphaerales bacterium]